MNVEVEDELRRLLAEALGVDRAVVDRLPADADLLAGPLPVGSLAGARLLAAIRDRFGVDLAAEDLALDCLQSLAALRAAVTTRVTGPARSG
jgi:acyl carrier protein